MIELTIDKVKAIAEQVVSEKPEDFVYVDNDGTIAGGEESATCTYVHYDGAVDLANAAPGCLVGQILHRAGVTLEQLAIGDSCFNGDHSLAAFELLGALRDDSIIGYTSKAKDFLKHLQSMQDSGNTWRTSLNFALGRL